MSLKWHLNKYFENLVSEQGCLDLMQLQQTEDKSINGWEKVVDHGFILRLMIHKKHNGVSFVCAESLAAEMHQFEQFNEELEHEQYKAFRSEWMIFHKKYFCAATLNTVYKHTNSNSYVLVSWKYFTEQQFNKDFGYVREINSKSSLKSIYTLQLQICAQILLSHYLPGGSEIKLAIVLLHKDNGENKKIDVDNFKEENTAVMNKIYSDMAEAGPLTFGNTATAKQHNNTKQYGEVPEAPSKKRNKLNRKNVVVYGCNAAQWNEIKVLTQNVASLHLYARGYLPETIDILIQLKPSLTKKFKRCKLINSPTVYHSICEFRQYVKNFFGGLSQFALHVHGKDPILINGTTEKKNNTLATKTRQKIRQKTKRVRVHAQPQLQLNILHIPKTHKRSHHKNIDNTASKNNYQTRVRKKIAEWLQETQIPATI